MIAILGILCMTIVGFQITRFFLKFFYNNFLGPYLGINAVNLSTMGKWAGKYLLYTYFVFINFINIK